VGFPSTPVYYAVHRRLSTGYTRGKNRSTGSAGRRPGESDGTADVASSAEACPGVEVPSKGQFIGFIGQFVELISVTEIGVESGFRSG
jgi:hypothetical protein